MQLVITSWIIFTLSIILFQVEHSICTHKRTRHRSKNIPAESRSDKMDEKSAEEYEGVEFKQDNYKKDNHRSLDDFGGGRKAIHMPISKGRKLGKETEEVFDDDQPEVHDFENVKEVSSKSEIPEENNNKNNNKKKQLMVAELVLDYMRLGVAYLKEKLKKKD